MYVTKGVLFCSVSPTSTCPQVAAAAGLQEEVVSKAKQSRSEKKARKAISKLGEAFITNGCVCHIPG